MPFQYNMAIVLIGITIKEKYKVTGFIRGGGFGDVFNAVHTEKKYDVAVKFVSVPQFLISLGRPKQLRSHQAI